MVNYGRFNNYEEFIKGGRTLTTQKEKIDYVANYIKFLVEYNYTFYLGAMIYNAGISDFQYKMQEIDRLKSYLITIPNTEDVTHLAILDVVYTESEYITALCDACDDEIITKEQLDENIERVKDIIREIILYNIRSYELTEYYIEDFIKNIKTQMSLKQTDSNGNIYTCDLLTSLILVCIAINIYSPAEEKNGLLTKGVCLDFSEFVTKALNDMAVPTLTVIGSEHAWNIVYLNGEYRFIDTTFNGFADYFPYYRYAPTIITKELYEENLSQLNNQWLNIDLETLFKQDLNRKIEIIGSTVLSGSSVINYNNYDEPRIQKVFERTLNKEFRDNMFCK